MDRSGRVAGLLRAALVAAIVVPGVPAGAEGVGPDGSEGVATGEAAAEAIARRGAINAFASVSEDTGKTAWTSSETYVPVDGMTLTVRARRRSMLVITFTAECNAEPPSSDPGAGAAVLVEARVNGVRVPGTTVDGNVVFCGNRAFFSESHSFRWVYPVQRIANEVTIHFLYTGPDDGLAGLSDRILDVLYDPSSG